MMFLQVMIDNVRDVFSSRFFAYFNTHFTWSAFPSRCRSKHWV